MHVQISGTDTVAFSIVSLDSGVTTDSLEVWDRGGNRSVKSFQLTYSGEKTYPPKINPIAIAPIAEHSSFDTLYLDSCVKITDPSATYSVDSLKWTISVDALDSGMTVDFDSTTRKLHVGVTSGEISKDRKTLVSFRVTDPSGNSDEQKSVPFWVIEKNDPPEVVLKNQTVIGTAVFDTLKIDTCFFDPDPAQTLSIVIERGHYLKPDSISVLKCTGGSKLGQTQSVFPYLPDE